MKACIDKWYTYGLPIYMMPMFSGRVNICKEHGIYERWYRIFGNPDQEIVEEIARKL